IAGRDWPWHRLLNLVLHGISVAFFYALARRVLRDAHGGGMQPDWIAFLATALFALHPAVVYAEAYLAARPLLLQGMFGMIALWAVLRAAEESWRGVWCLAPIAYVGAMLASPAALGLPLGLAVAVYAVTPARRWGPAWAGVAACVVIGLAWCVWWAMQGAADAVASGYVAALGDNAWRWLRGVGYGLAPITAWMAIDMPEPNPAAPTWLAVVSVMVYVALVVIALRALRRPAWRAAGAAGGILAALSFTEIVFPGAWSAFAPWRSYPWIAFVCLAAAWTLARLRAPIVLALGSTAIIACAVLALLTLRTFSSHVAVWDHAIRAADIFGAQAKDARLYVNRGTLHRSQGHTLAAVEDYGRALTLHPDFPRALRGRAQAHIDERRYPLALRDLQRLLEVEPEQFGTHADIGLVYMQTGKYAEAMKSFNTALAKGVKEPKLYLNRGLALLQMGGLGAAPRALDDIERALALDPDYALAHFNRGLIFDQAASAGMRLRDAVSPEIMRIVAKQNIARACQLGHRPACDVERSRAAEQPKVEEMNEAPLRLTPEKLREQGLIKGR
ncbi:MAG: tetratricopeptide repeat protein, partial [Burkholderiales bacterium]|nr:tetratricopeptide repeat protein [Burkholderiales bacterium]